MHTRSLCIYFSKKKSRIRNGSSELKVAYCDSIVNIETLMQHKSSSFIGTKGHILQSVEVQLSNIKPCELKNLILKIEMIFSR